MPEDAITAQVPAWIVLQRDRDINPVLVILLYALDERDLPLRAMSMMSPPELGQSRTRLPFSTSTPPTFTLRSVGLPSSSRKKSIRYSLSIRNSRTAPCRFMSSS